MSTHTGFNSEHYPNLSILIHITTVNNAIWYGVCFLSYPLKVHKIRS